jgi:hypothetical protein
MVERDWALRFSPYPLSYGNNEFYLMGAEFGM